MTGAPLPSTGGEPDDDQLLDGVQARQPGALEALYDRHHQVALAVALRLLRNQQLAEDVVQEAFLAVWRQSASYREGRGSVRNWLLSIVHHRAVDVLRRRDVARPPVALDTLEATMGDIADTGRADVWEDAARNIEGARVRAALAALPPEQRQTVELAYFGGLTCQQVSERVRVPLGTVKGRMRLALQKLRVILGPEMADEAQVGSLIGDAGTVDLSDVQGAA